MFVLVFESVGSEQTKNLPGKKSLVCFGIIHVDTEFQLLVSRFFLNFFRRGLLVKLSVRRVGGGCQAASLPGPNSAGSPRRIRTVADLPTFNSRTVEQIAVCLDKGVPVASEAWHVLVWVKVLAR